MPSAIAAAVDAGQYRYKLTVDEFDRMCEAGIFDEDDRIELLDGELYEMPPAGDWHNAGVVALTHSFTPAAGNSYLVSVQNSVRMSTGSKPIPDLTILRFRADHYREGGAGPEDVLLVVEVSDTTVKHDRERKLQKYAEAKVPEVWLVTRESAAIEVYRRPRAGSYLDVAEYGREQFVAAMSVPGVTVKVSDITG